MKFGNGSDKHDQEIFMDNEIHFAQTLAIKLAKGQKILMYTRWNPF